MRLRGNGTERRWAQAMVWRTGSLFFFFSTCRLGHGEPISRLVFDVCMTPRELVFVRRGHHGCWLSYVIK